MLAVSRHLAGLRRRWDDASAVRAEHCLDPTWRRRLDRLPQRWDDRRALRRERAARRRRIDGAAELGFSQAWTKGLPVELPPARRGPR